MTEQVYNYKVKVHVQNGLGVLARMTILLRKFNVNVQSIYVDPLDESKEFYNIHFVLDSTKNEIAMGVVMKKLERLIPILKVHFTKTHDTNGL